MQKFVDLRIDATIANLILNRPERHNSLVPEMLEQFLEALAQINDSSTVRVVLLTANGRSFSTGGDLRGFYEHRADLEEYAAYLVGLLNRAILAMIEMPLTLVTAIHGMVTGGSLGLVLASDLVLVTPQASFTPFYSVVGFSPDGGWTAMLPAIIGPRRTSQALMANHTISAQQAVEWGLVNRLVAPDELDSQARQLANEIAGMQPGSLKATKRLMWADRQALEARLEAERDRFLKQVVTQEARQGLAAFLGVA